MKITVLYGGVSAEHDISVISAYNIINALLNKEYEIQPIYIRRDNVWLKGPLVEESLVSSEALILEEAVVESWTDSESPSTGYVIKPGDILEEDTVVFPVLHGPNGEDGTIQGFLEVLNMPYVGADVISSAVGMDKIVSKQLFDHAGLPQVPYVAFTETDWKNDRDSLIQKCEGNLLYPFFIKPANMGSSVGISKVDTQEELIEAVEAALEYDRRIVVEQGIIADECEVAVLGNDDAHASVVGKLLKDADFYDYEEKYINNTVQMEIPAQMDESTSTKLQHYALEAYRAIGGCGLARVDFFVSKNGDIYINEINTMPGFTQYSMYPVLWQATGLEYRDLVEELIQLGISRYKKKVSKVEWN